MTQWVTDASPLIFLAKLDRLDLLRTAAASIVVPAAVLDEVAARRDAASIQIRSARWLEVREPTRNERLSSLQRVVGGGEAAAIALGLDVGAERVVLDDMRARRRARELGLQPVGTLGLLLAARLRGELPSLDTEIQRLLVAGFRASPALIAAALEAAGERPPAA